jgi:hypothetical protein
VLSARPEPLAGPTSDRDAATIVDPDASTTRKEIAA